MHSVDVAASIGNEGPQESPVDHARAIWHAYLKGQLASVAKAALWWSTFGIIAVSMLESDIALAATRGPFNMALLLSSPLAAAAAEKWSIRSLLLATTIGRFLIWSVCIPIAWIVFHSWLGWLRALWITFIGFMLLDGVQVAFSNAVDIDCGGLDYLSSVYDLPLTDFLRYRFTTVHQLVFDSSFVFFTPPVVVGLVFLYSWWTRSSSRDFLPVYITGTDLSVFVLTMGVAVVFGLLSLLSFRYYYKGIPPVDTVDTSHQGSVLTRSLSDSNPPANRRTSSDRVVAWDYKAKLWEIADGFFIVASDKALKWRLVLLAVETALEDTMVSVIIPITALHATAFVGHTSSKTAAALINVVTIAVGKLGGVLAGVYLASSWSYDGICSRNGKRLFELVLFSSLSLILIPIGYTLAASGLHNHVPIESTIVSDISAASVFQWLSDRSGILGCIALLTGVALFFIFSTAPKIGFASLIQSLVTNEDDVAKVFSFVGMFVTIADGLMIAFINLVLYWIPDFELGLWVVFGIYAIHGLLEYFFGSQLIAEAPSGGLRAYRMEHD